MELLSESQEENDKTIVAAARYITECLEKWSSSPQSLSIYSICFYGDLIYLLLTWKQ